MVHAATGGKGMLTTHVLDTASGEPAAGLRIDLLRVEGGTSAVLATCTTNADGRCDAPLLSGEAMAAGVFELVFHAGAYFRARGAKLSEPAFLDAVPVRFGIADTARHYHVPLLISPFGYSTYRGS